MANVKNITTIKVEITKEEREKLEDIYNLINDIESSLERHDMELDSDGVEWEGYNSGYDIGSILFEIRRYIEDLIDASL